jgi:uncharacterized protein YneF (UPF0154 family)
MFKTIVITAVLGIAAGFAGGIYVARNWVAWREKAKIALKEKMEKL